jgi:hypothetical protein
MTYRRRVTPLPSAPLRRPLSPAEDIAMAPVIAAARKAGAAGVVLILRGGAEVTLILDGDNAAEVGKPWPG